MSTPPQDIPHGSLFHRITQLPRPHKVVDFPRVDPSTGKSIGQVAIWVLLQGEHEASIAAAETAVRGVLKEQGEPARETSGYRDLYTNMAACEMLFRACRDPRDLKSPAFPGPVEMRRTMTADEIGVLMAHYHTTQEELGPIVSRMSADEIDAWIKVTVESGSRDPLDLLSSGALKILAFSLASLVHSLRTGTSSPGKPPDDGSLSNASSPASA